MPKFEAKVYVTLKEGVQDPVGQTLLKSLPDIGVEGVTDLSTGKYFQLRLEAESDSAAEKILHKLCDRLLANPNIERFTYEIEK